MTKLLNWLLAHHRVSFLAVFVLTLAFAPGVPRISFDTSANMLVQEDDPQRVFYDEARETFGDDLILSIVVKSDHLFSPPLLAAIERITGAAESIPGVNRVVSLSTVSDLRGRDGFLETDYLVPSIPEDETAAAEIRTNALGNDLFQGEVISKDGRTTAVNLFVADDPANRQFNQQLVDAVEQILQRERKILGREVELYQAGNSVLKVSMLRSIRRDMTLLLPVAFVVVFATIFFLYRRGSAVVIPLVTGTISVIITVGFMGYAGIPFNPITAIIPILLVVIGATEDIHLISEHGLALSRGKIGRAAVESMNAKGGLAALLTALTTFLGFATIIGNAIPALRDFGIAASFGIAINFVVTIATVPPLLLLLSPRGDHPTRAGGDRQAPWLLRSARFVARFGTRHRSTVIALAFLLGILCLLASQRIVVNTNYLSFFHEDAPLRRSFEDISEQLAGANSFYVVINTGEEDGLKNPATLKAIAGLADFLSNRADKVSGFPFLIRKAHQEINDGDTTFHRIPDTTELIAQYSILLNQDDLDRFVSPDFSSTCLLARTNEAGSLHLRMLANEINGYVEAHFPRGLEAAVTGELILVANGSDQIAEGIWYSLGFLLLAVFVVISLLFWSLKAGLLSMIPNIIPVMVNFGAMGLLGIQLGPGTFSVAMIAFGIAVDDTIHFMARYLKELKTTETDTEAVESSVMKEFRPVLASTVALVAGFLVLSFSEFASTAEFGILAATSLAAALISDLFLAPAVIGTVPLISSWDYLLLKISPDRLRQSQIFKGLKPSQIRRMALTGSLLTVNQGETVIRQGDLGSDVYFIVEGRARVLMTEADGSGERTLGEYQRGDLFGEMAFITGEPRSATVVAVNDLELLRIDEQALNRVRQNYPRIALVFFHNLSHLLSERLKRTNQQ